MFMHSVITVAIVFGILVIEPAAGQESANPGLSLRVVGISTKDYAESMTLHQGDGFSSGNAPRDKLVRRAASRQRSRAKLKSVWSNHIAFPLISRANG